MNSCVRLLLFQAQSKGVSEHQKGVCGEEKGVCKNPFPFEQGQNHWMGEEEEVRVTETVAFGANALSSSIKITRSSAKVQTF